MSLLQKQTDKQSLFFESKYDRRLGGEKCSLNLKETQWFWSDRLVLIEGEHNNDFWSFTAFDLLINEERQIRFRRSKTSENFVDVDIYPINGEFGFVIEEFDYEVQYFQHVNLVKFDWDTCELESVECIKKQADYSRILVDKLEASKFVLQFTDSNSVRHYQICNVAKNRVEFGGIHQHEIRFDYYSKDRLVYIDVNFDEMVITVYDMASKKEETFEIDKSSLPENVYLMRGHEWINERLYTNIKFEDTQKYGIAWTDLKTKKWNLVEFETNIRIKNLTFFNNNLIVEANHGTGWYGSSMEIKMFNVPMRKPNPLRQKAWIMVVKIMKKIGKKDKFAAARDYLPLNSDLREPWFKDEEKQTK